MSSITRGFGFVNPFFQHYLKYFLPEDIGRGAGRFFPKAGEPAAQKRSP